VRLLLEGARRLQQLGQLIDEVAVALEVEVDVVEGLLDGLEEIRVRRLTAWPQLVTSQFGRKREQTVMI